MKNFQPKSSPPTLSCSKNTATAYTSALHEKKKHKNQSDHSSVQNDHKNHIVAEKLQEISEDDLQALCEALDAAILGNNSTGWLKVPSRKMLQCYFQGALLVPGRSVYVIRLNSVIVGSIQLIRPARSNEEQAMSCSLQGFFLAPYTQGLSLTKTLLNAATQAAYAQGYQFLHIEVRQDLTRLITTLGELGFEHWGTNPYFARTQKGLVSGLLFTKSLKDDKDPSKTDLAETSLEISTPKGKAADLNPKAPSGSFPPAALPSLTPTKSLSFCVDTSKIPTPPATPHQNNAPTPQKPFFTSTAKHSMTRSALTIYPAIDLKEGHCVRLRQGEMEQATIYSDNPAEQALSWEKSGFEHLHIVDLDGAFAGHSQNTDAILSILKATTLPVQLGGGIRDMKAIHHWINAGVQRIILGSAAVKNPDLVKEACQTYPGRIIAGIDARYGQVLTEGWAQSSNMHASELALLMQDAGAAAIIFTEISRDGMLTGLDLEQTIALANSLSIPVIASGGIGTLEDLKALRQATEAAPGIEGVIIGRALYDGRIAPTQALEALK
ncbi:1-(5-phosphoribosyl)-5-[(5-phosphoribosylamino)methylideneamino]imidazole-4-carboxamide isomerase [Entomobacter blattae]|uniref:1-(5-phosphoribosyl)-5-[(5-phosphoribosylamino)methylideneamino] imidazole-4-carboxamide isomerase n=1 Tax=Entomobacter blattae TaxID=2762277 RepID=A0A7H1NUN0_9PROT|nr:1-(5-phosphoribosyl)-5-[(5-phosphoribosylamino)methylideneamino]imidazole-4-carboxamide isomerase [Entomobacter blattae]QNT79490.1 Imidazole glycerol phosphate synthase subunit HisF [Entomobacter blattae]